MAAWTGDCLRESMMSCLSLLDKGVRFDTMRPVLEINAPSLFGLEQDLTRDYQAVKVSIFLEAVTAQELIAFDSKVKSWLENNITPYSYEGGVGPDLLFAKLGERNARSMFFSLGLALVVIALIIGGLLRSWSATLIGLICNLFPVVTVFALWSLIGGYISLGSAMVMGMIMGIIVDDTLHMLIEISADFKCICHKFGAYAYMKKFARLF